MGVRSRAVVSSAALVLVGLAAPIAPAFAAADPSAICAPGDDDRARPIPQSLAARARAALGFASEAPDDYVVRSTVYRCMDGVVWVCTHGANLSCAKADTAPASAGAEAWCREHPGADEIPAYATGHDTAYAWTCAGTKAVAGRASPLDRRGFFADQWKPIRD
ncbi:hypothetical protein DFR50_14221 [Roseiarcus fermentans]|uniref:Secreted protein n=1 Tax=Roseiarcus fermentans TaxID=1473586 RepID=A0A366ENC6_9HYPH|nr:hypothetical protein [Roseiarcus fermentans]RBP03774.1 hypothetical protein DFR50_14221 [Roseiarcus fermentans]